MCGGAGTRLDHGEKPLFEIGGEPMVERVIDALDASEIDASYAVTSSHTPETTRHLESLVHVIETEGAGYVDDLADALEHVDRPVLTVVADLPLLSGSLVDRAIGAYESGSLTVCVPTILKRRLGVSVDTTCSHGGRALAPTGLNVVGEEFDETIHVSYDGRLAVNVNRPGDAAVAEEFAETIDADVGGDFGGS